MYNLFYLGFLTRFGLQLQHALVLKPSPDTGVFSAGQPHKAQFEASREEFVAPDPFGLADHLVAELIVELEVHDDQNLPAVEPTVAVHLAQQVVQLIAAPASVEGQVALREKAGVDFEDARFVVNIDLAAAGLISRFCRDTDLRTMCLFVKFGF